MSQQWSLERDELDHVELVSLGAWPKDRRLSLTITDPTDELVEIVDPEGVPLIEYDVSDGSYTILNKPEHVLFRKYLLTPDEARDAHGPLRAAVVTAPLTTRDVEQLATEPTFLLVAMRQDDPDGVSPSNLFRSTLAAEVPGAVVIPLPMKVSAPTDFLHAVARRYSEEVIELLHVGPTHREVQRTINSAPRIKPKRGLVVFFTGLSGSGKSTLARALRDHFLENGVQVTSLDGDVVRRMLASELGFSMADRDTNVLRLGWVAAQIARHGGTAICSPIAPTEHIRVQVRQMVEQEGGDFALVHVATPLEECERRDRKGLYAKARAGLISDFTGISSPYEEPIDPLVRIDTTGRDVEDEVEEILAALEASGISS